MPITIKKHKASILKDGCFLINVLIGLDTSNMITTVTITAVYIIQSSRTIPYHHCQTYAPKPQRISLIVRQLFRQNGNENDVVNPKNHF